MAGIEPFHVRYHWLLIIAAIGGIHVPAMDKWFASQWSTRLLHFFMLLANSVLTTQALMAIYHFIYVATNLYNWILDLMVIAASILVVFRVYWYFAKKTEYLAMLEWWDNDFYSLSDAAHREKLIKEEMKYVKKFMAGANASSFIAIELWMISQYFSEDKTLKYPTPIPYEHKSPDFDFVLSFHLVGSIFYNFANYGIHFFNLLALVWQLCELRRLKLTLKDILRLTEEKKRWSEMITVIDLRLNVWIRQHQHLISFHNACWIIMFSHSMEMLATFMASWLIAFNYVQEAVPLDDKISEIFFFLPYGVMFGLTCFYADLVRDESLRIFDDGYGENWAKLPKKHRDSLVIIAQQTQRPFITKGFKMYITGNRTFFQILQSSYTVLNFLIAAFRKRALERDNVQ